MTLQKKWKNIKDSYAREKRRLSGVKSGSAAERKTPYVFYNTLTFLNTNNPSTNTHSNVDRQDPDNTDLLHLDIEAPAANPDPTGPYETRVLAKKRKPKDEVGQQLVKILKDSAEERRNREIELTSDEDRLFLMSLVSDLKRVPEHLKLSVKRQLMAVLEQNQVTPAGRTSYTGYAQNQNYQYPSHSGSNAQFAPGYSTTPYGYPSRQHTSTPLSYGASSEYSGGDINSADACTHALLRLSLRRPLRNWDTAARADKENYWPRGQPPCWSLTLVAGRGRGRGRGRCSACSHLPYDAHYTDHDHDQSYAASFIMEVSGTARTSRLATQQSDDQSFDSLVGPDHDTTAAKNNIGYNGTSRTATDNTPDPTSTEWSSEQCTLVFACGANIQKKWRHLKNSFCREKRRISGAKSGGAADRKTPYGTPPVITQSSIDRQDPVDLQEPTENIDLPNGPYQSRVVTKKRKSVDKVGKQLINVLKNSSEERKKFEKEVLEDEDKLFMMSLVNDFKNIPQEMKLSAKRQILTVIEQHQHGFSHNLYPQTIGFGHSSSIRQNPQLHVMTGNSGPRFDQHPLSGGTGVNTGYEQQAGVRTSTPISSVGSFSEYSEDQCSPRISCFQDNVK
ncbi:hypothetical protein J6590_081413 [Homalodisca vitripennis]|nr:hypothetical protein J6590_081413 [Homalodisca vitripennis]